MSRLKGKVILITGASSGIGRETAVAAAQQGAKLVLGARRESEGLAVLEAVKKAGGQGIFQITDVTTESDVQRLVAEAVKAFGRIDGVFANAGVESLGDITTVTADEYRRVFDTNVLGVIYTLKHTIAQLRKQNSPGSIVTTSSIAGQIGMAQVGVYVASKHAVNGLTKSVALENAAAGIRVNSISPAAIDTDMFRRFADTPEKQAYMAGLHPLKRVGTVKEIADPVIFLLSDESSFMTGQDLVIDGGFTAQ